MGLEVRMEERVTDGNLRVIPEVVVVAVDTNEPSLEELCCFMARGGGMPLPRTLGRQRRRKPG